ncbi:terminase small subunit [Paracoccus sp. NSM]|uniref:terminase small subunit n=1 Tax=Paracoccus sp. NSM TaxID=3457784 RepID=UPI0040360E12
MPRPRLTEMKLKWCQEYAIKPDAKAAALAAGYSPAGAHSRGYENSQCPDCMAEVARLRALEDEKFLLRKTEVIRELAILAMADLGDVLEWGQEPVEDDDGLPVTLPNGEPVMRPVVTPINSRAIPAALRRAISEVSMSDKGTFKVKMHDRMKALEMLARIHGLFEKDNEQAGKAAADSIAALIEAVQGKPLSPTTDT